MLNSCLFVVSACACSTCVWAVGAGLAGTASAAEMGPYDDPAEPALPQTDVEVTLANTALVVTDPQKKVLGVIQIHD